VGDPVGDWVGFPVGDPVGDRVVTGSLATSPPVDTRLVVTTNSSSAVEASKSIYTSIGIPLVSSYVTSTRRAFRS